MASNPQLDPHELQLAFQFLSHDGVITAKSLKKKTGLSAKDVQLLLNGKTELTEQDLSALVQGAELENFDPVAEAFELFSSSADGRVPTSTGREQTPRGSSGGSRLSAQLIKSTLHRLGYTEANDEDVRRLLETLDLDRDGSVGLCDRKSIQLTARIVQQVSTTSERCCHRNRIDDSDRRRRHRDE